VPHGLRGWTTLVALSACLVTGDRFRAEMPRPLQPYFGDLGTPADGAAAAVRARYHLARDEAEMDFLAIVAATPSTALVETAAGITASERGSFVALDAWSFGPQEIGRPVVVLGGRRVDDPSGVPLGRFDLFYRFWLPDHADRTSGAPVLHLPAPARSGADYGLASLGSIDALREAARPYARTMDVVGGAPGHDATAGSGTSGAWTRYLDYLNAGFRLAPTAGWWQGGTRARPSEYRTAVLATELTRAALLDAVGRRRVYASGDRNLRASFSINGHPMGSVVPVAAGTPLRIEVTMSDPNEPDAHYWVSLRRDERGGSVEAAVELFGTDYHGDGRVVFSHLRRGRAAEYYLVEITQHSAEGTDVVWAAPIWLDAPGDVGP
jgi:hypothetical protein